MSNDSLTYGENVRLIRLFLKKFYQFVIIEIIRFFAQNARRDTSESNKRKICML